MNPRTRKVVVPGPVGRIDCALDLPAVAPRGVAVIAHPHPLFGGTRDNKVVQTMARALLALGYVCWRPNFRGVGASEGEHDEGEGELEDLLAVTEYALADASAPTSPELVLAGFSFGSFVQSHAVQRLTESGRPVTRAIMVGTAVSRWPVAPLPPSTLVIHGENDDVVPLADVLDWARPLAQPVTVVPGADHFFHRKLTVLKNLVVLAWGRVDLLTAGAS
ncbi:MAG: alpha/beta hydrolase [Burkholderiales bacterium]|nr:MAG: alpha/beta hydrolase [Burkholderiales bacterium]